MGILCSKGQVVYSSDIGTSDTSTRATRSRASRKNESQAGMFSSSSSGQRDSVSSDAAHRENDAVQDDGSPGSHVTLGQNTVEDPPPVPKPRPVAVDPKIASLAEFSRDLARLMCGRMDVAVPCDEKMIYIYHCSEFTDSVVERSVLQQLVYPAVREHCVRRGCDLVVYDVHLGCKDEFAHGHMIRDLSQDVMKQCVSRDRRPLLTVFLNEKYGVYWCPRTIEQDQFEQILRKLTEEDRHFLLQWYELDMLRSPPSYVLCAVETHISKYSSDRADEYKEGYHEWQKHLIRLRHVICQGSSADFQRNICKSAVDESLESFVFSNQWPKDQITWLRRIFYSDVEFDVIESTYANFLDIVVDRVNDVAQIRLKGLFERLNDKVDEQSRVVSHVEWTGEGIDLNEESHSGYLDKLCATYKDLTLQKVDAELTRKEEISARCKKAIHQGLTKDLYNEIHQQTLACQRLTGLFDGKEQLLDTIDTYIRTGNFDAHGTSDSTIRPLVVHGIAGSGKSTIMAEVARRYCTVDGWTAAVAVVRFVGATVRCETGPQLLLTVREQLCVLAGLPIASAHQTGDDYSLDRILNKMPSGVQVLLIIDGLDQLLDQAPGIDWMPSELPSHVRIIVSATTDSSWIKSIQNGNGKTVLYTEVPLLTSKEIVAMCQSKYTDKHIVLPETIENLLKEKLPSSTPLHITILLIVLMEKSTPLEKQCELISASADDLLNVIFEHLEVHLQGKFVQKLACYIACSRHGLSDPEIMDVLGRDEDIISSTMNSEKSTTTGVPFYLWLFMKNIIKPLLLERNSHGCLVYQWRYQVVHQIIQTRYESLEDKCQQHLLAYYNGSFNDKQLKNNTIKQAGKVSVKPVKLNDTSCCTGRKLDDLPWLLYKQDKTSEMGNLFLDLEWLISKLSESGVMAVDHDLDLCIQKHNDETMRRSLVFLRSLLRELSNSITEDPSQLMVQLHLRSKCKVIDVPNDLPGIQALFRTCAMNKCPILSASDAKNDPLKLTYLPAEFNKPESNNFSGFFHFKNEPDHIISVSPAQGELQVWNIFNNESVRKFTGMKQPKDVKICDVYKAVVLCDRDLKVYDLDDGRNICSLKGVLNIRMPFFGVHDAEHTIAMSRNRMYVNMLSNTNGEMVTTFKVGEDRFMDSMLNSENGEKCVCGDAVQKPFPLLVWDLLKRKLIYDLRIQGHEFLTKVSAISKDGHYVVCACRELEDPDPTFLVVYDLQSGSLFKKWKNTYSPTSVVMSQLLVVSGHENGTVCVWDLISGSLKHELLGHSRGPDFLRLSDNGSRCVSWDTTGRDLTIRLWNLDKGDCLGTFYPGCKVSCCNISQDGSMVVIGLPGVKGIVTLLPPGEHKPKKKNAVFGDSSRKGAVFDVSQPQDS